MSEALFRREVIDARRHRLVGTVIAAVPPSSRLYTGVVAGAGAFILLVLLFAGYAPNVEVRGIVAYSQGMSRVYASSPGEVRSVAVRANHSVTAGDTIVEVSLAQGRNGLSAQIGQLDAQIAEVDRQLALARSTTETQASSLREQRAALVGSTESLARQQTLAMSQVALAERGAGRAVRLAREGAGTQRQVEDARGAVIARRSDAEALQDRLLTTKAAIADLEGRIGQQGLEQGRSNSQLLAQRAALAAQRDAMERADHVTVTAPISGVIGDISVEPGQRVTPQSSIATVVPRDSRKEVWLYAPSHAVGFARPGLHVRLQFDAFPYQKYGVGAGTVIAVSPVAIDPASLDAVLGIKEPVFRLRVRIDDVGLHQIHGGAIRAGMTVAARIVLKRRPLWALAFGTISS